MSSRPEKKRAFAASKSPGTILIVVPLKSIMEESIEAKKHQLLSFSYHSLPSRFTRLSHGYGSKIPGYPKKTVCLKEK